MFTPPNLNNLNSLGSYDNPIPWYANRANALNGVFPSLIHQYDKGRYYNSTNGQTAFPFTTTRTTNAMMFNSTGDLVFAPANMIPQSTVTGGTVGVLGSGGVMPTTWNWGTPDAGLTRELLEIGNDYIVVRMYGTNTHPTNITYPHISFVTTVTNLPVVVGQSYTVSATLQLLAGSFNNTVSSSSGRVTSQWRNAATSYIGEIPNSVQADSTERRVFGSSVAPALSAFSSPQINIAIPALSGPIDFTIKISRPQFEPTSVTSPLRYIPTTGSAKYCERIEYNPGTLAIRGLLVEGAQTNIMPRSSATAANWETASNATPTDSGTQWTFPVVKLTVSSLAGPQFSYINSNTLNPSTATQYVVSAFVKKDNYRYVQLTTSGNYTGLPPAGAWLNYDFDTNTIQQGGTDAVASSGLATVLNNGWVRLQIAFTTTSTTGGAGVIIGFPNDLTSARLATCTTNGAAVLVFGVQAEAGNLASSHIPTYGVQATRAADIFVLTPLPWINQTLGTLYVSFIPNRLDPSNLRRFIDISDNSANNRVQMARTTAGQASAVTSLAGVADFAPGSVTVLPSFTRNKAALRYIAGNKRVVANGGAVGSNTNINVPASGLTHLTVGSVPGYASANTHGGWIEEVRYYPDNTASDAQLQALTTV